MTSASIRWRRLDQPGHDTARLSESSTGARVEGTAVFSESGRPCRLDYRIICDPQWRTVAARVSGWIDSSPFEVDISVDSTRQWTINGRRCGAVDGCLDVDLSFTPATNLLPIRRLKLAVGACAAVRATWLDFPNVGLEPLDQIYERVAESRYAYESGGGSFHAVLLTNASGFVTDYSGLWRAEDPQ